MVAGQPTNSDKFIFRSIRPQMRYVFRFIYYLRAILEVTIRSSFRSYIQELCLGAIFQKFSLGVNFQSYLQELFFGVLVGDIFWGHLQGLSLEVIFTSYLQESYLGVVFRGYLQELSLLSSTSVRLTKDNSKSQLVSSHCLFAVNWERLIGLRFRFRCLLEFVVINILYKIRRNELDTSC